MIDIQPLLDKHEIMKCKGLSLKEDDLFNWIMLWEEMLDTRTTLRSEYQEEKQQLGSEEGVRKIQLKGETDEGGKKKHTESTADITIEQEFGDREKLLATKKLTIERIENKTAVIEQYINLVKLYMNKNK